MPTEIQSKIIEVIDRTHDVKSFRFERKDGIDYKAGQFMEVYLDADGQVEKRYLSFSSSPTETGFCEFTKKITGSVFSQKLAQLQKGDEIRLKCPMGAFVLQQDPGKIIFLSGGIGITPIQSMLQYAFDAKTGLDAVLFYGNRTKDDIAFKEQLDALEGQLDHLQVVHTLETADADWPGETGFINADMIKKYAPDFAERTFLICGPPAMVKIFTEMLKTDMQVPAGQIKFENFMGY